MGLLTRTRQGWVLAAGGPAPDAPVLELESAGEAAPQSTRRTQREKSAEKLRSTPSKPKKSAENPRFRENLQVMDDQGIKENATTRLIVAMDYVTTDYIRAHARYARKNDEKSGLAIHRMRRAGPLRGNPNGHPHNCRCHACWVAKVHRHPEWYQS